MTPKTEKSEQLSRLLGLTTSFLKLAKDLQDQFQKKQVSLDLAGGILCFLLAKTLTTTEAVLTLCREQCAYPKDALILVRSVYEAALWASDIFREPDLTAEKAIAFIRNEPFDRKKMLEKMLALVQEELNAGEKLEDRPPDGGYDSAKSSISLEQRERFKEKLTEELEKAEQEISKIEKEYKVRKSLLNYGKRNFDQLARDAGLLHIHHAFYWQSSLYAHNRPRSSISFVRETEKGWEFCWGPEKKQIDDVLVYLCHFLWYLLDKFNWYFKLQRDDLILEKWQGLDEIFSLASKEE